MKKQYLLFLMVMAVAFLLFSCSEEGGTIEIYNPKGNTAVVTITEGVNVVKNAEEIPANSTRNFTFDKNGIYAIGYIYVSLSPNPSYDEAILLGGNTVKITLK